MEQTKKDEIQDLINAAYQNIGNATKQSDGITVISCLLGSIAHSLVALVEMEAWENDLLTERRSNLYDSEKDNL